MQTSTKLLILAVVAFACTADAASRRGKHHKPKSKAILGRVGSPGKCEFALASDHKTKAPTLSALIEMSHRANRVASSCCAMRKSNGGHGRTNYNCAIMPTTCTDSCANSVYPFVTGTCGATLKYEIAKRGAYSGARKCYQACQNAPAYIAARKANCKAAPKVKGKKTKKAKCNYKNLRKTAGQKAWRKCNLACRSKTPTHVKYPNQGGNKNKGTDKGKGQNGGRGGRRNNNRGKHHKQHGNGKTTRGRRVLATKRTGRHHTVARDPLATIMTLFGMCKGAWSAERQCDKTFNCNTASKGLTCKTASAKCVHLAVCGVDGKTYANECYAQCHGIQVSTTNTATGKRHHGKSKTGACSANTQNQCGCPTVNAYKPVCSYHRLINGMPSFKKGARTWANECVAKCHKQRKYVQGTCVSQTALQAGVCAASKSQVVSKCGVSFDGFSGWLPSFNGFCSPACKPYAQDLASCMSTNEATILAAIAHKLPQRKKLMVQLFTKLDLDHDNKLTSSEIATAFTGVGTKLTGAQLHSIMAQIKCPATGCNKKKFVTWITSKRGGIEFWKLGLQNLQEFVHGECDKVHAGTGSMSGSGSTH